ncbi:MAG: adenosylhomocysteinase [Armatimonadetes bacterium]|nr:adenosylhomocysteinase [Armatimonadota bacterium]NIM23453.1 adenosylhomocysteinase [Armatimonadota bacterium]NIM67318.1 adenosylhomocysteinase [Armatimonadota bacterium]NIM75816.1 adenosylhomocysteinase [Armatimonadota bacterium]NIN05504.1 adenosylhomocysteinase [Armatimonadota bacterium]
MTETAHTFDVAELSLADSGQKRIEWADREMPVLRGLRERFEVERPLQGVRIAACLHVTTETANLMRTLHAAGAEVAVCASNPLSTQDDTAAALVDKYDIPCFAIRGEDRDTYYGHIRTVLKSSPHITMDDGADLVSTVHRECGELAEKIVGGTEETTTGVIRLRAMANDGALKYPIIAVNDAYTKHLFDNRYGTGQSTIDGILRATNLLLAGRRFVVCGYGWCGRGIALRAKGMGAQVIVTETSPLRALEAAMDGHAVMPLKKAAQIGDVFVTATGNTTVIGREEFSVMKDGAILANAGHFNVEIDLEALSELCHSRRSVRPSVEEFVLDGERSLYLIGEGRLVNLAAAEGHPAAVMDMSFANQALCVQRLWCERTAFEPKVYAVPQDIDDEVASLKLAAMGLELDTLTPEQEQYLNSWRLGT